MVEGGDRSDPAPGQAQLTLVGPASGGKKVGNHVDGTRKASTEASAAFACSF